MTDIPANFDKLLKDNGYEYQNLGHNIFLIKNIILNEEIKKIYEEIEIATEADWKEDYLDGLKVLGRRKYGRTDTEKMIEEGLIEVTTSWVDKNIKLKNQMICYSIASRVNKIVKIIDSSMHYDGIVTLQRQYEGSELVEHVDSDTDPDIKLAAILYINDNYSKGEVFFSKLGIEIKPPAKSLLLFPSGEKYLHGVKAPGPGPHRYVLPSFIRQTVPKSI